MTLIADLIIIRKSSLLIFNDKYLLRVRFCLQSSIEIFKQLTKYFFIKYLLAYVINKS